MTYLNRYFTSCRPLLVRFILCPALFLASCLVGCSSRAIERRVAVEESHSALSHPRAEDRYASQSARADKINPRAFNHYVNAVLFEQAGLVANASESYKRALQFYPDSYEIRLSFAKTLYMLQRFANVPAALEIIDPVDEPVYRLLAAAYRAMGEADSARIAYLRLVMLDSSQTSPYAYLAGHYQRTGDLDSSVWACENLVRLQPNDFALWYELGKLQARKGDFNSAKASFQNSIDLNGRPNNILSFVRLGEVYQVTEKVDSAVALFKAAYDMEPSNIVVNRLLASHYLTSDSLAEALPYAHRVVQAAPHETAGVRRLGIIYYAIDSLRTADSIFTDLVDKGRGSVADHYYLGRIAVLEENFERAQSELTIVADSADSVYESWLDLGYVYRRLGQVDKEIETYQTGLSHVRDEDGTVRLLFALGAAHEQNGQEEKSIATFERLLANAPDFTPALNYLGYMLADKGERLEYAKELIARAVALEPDNAAFLDSYGWVYYRLKKFDEALIHLKRAAKLDNDPVIFDHLGDAYHAVGGLEQARTWWRKALEQDSNNERIREKLSD